MDDTKAVMSNKSWTGKDIAQLMELKGKAFRVSRNVIYGLAIILAAIIGWYVGSKI